MYDVLESTFGAWAEHQRAAAPYTARVVDLRGLSGSKQYELAICKSGVDCTATKRLPDLRDLTADQPIRVRKHIGISLAAELTLDGQVGGNIDYGGYGFVPVGSGSGPSRFYQLSANDRFADHLTTSLLLIAYPWALANAGCPWAQRWFVGVGTSLFEGTNANLFKQVDFRLGYELAHGLLLSTGPSFRSVDAPASLAAGSIVAVGANEPPPSFSTKPITTFAWSVGLGVDLAILGDAVNFVGKAFTGERSGAVNDRSSP
jgi:hypothetical protein